MMTKRDMLFTPIDAGALSMVVGGQSNSPIASSQIPGDLIYGCTSQMAKDMSSVKSTAPDGNTELLSCLVGAGDHLFDDLGAQLGLSAPTPKASTSSSSSKSK